MVGAKGCGVSGGGRYRPLQPYVVHCRSCKAPIFWATTSGDRRIPIDANPVPDGTLIVDGDVAYLLGSLGLEDYSGPRYQTHFATCPDAKGWRRKRGIPDPVPSASKEAR